MYVPRRLEKAPEYAASLQAVRDENRPNFGENLQTARNLVKFEPEIATRVRNSDLRIAEVYDQPNGYSLALYFVGGLADDAATLHDIKIFDLPPGFVPADWI